MVSETYVGKCLLQVKHSVNCWEPLGGNQQPSHHRVEGSETKSKLQKEIYSMKRLSSKEIKKILLGTLLSDGSIQKDRYRFDLYSKSEEHAQYICNVLNQITGVSATMKIKRDKRGYVGYRVLTRKHEYFKKLYRTSYNGRKVLSHYNVSRLDAEAMAHVWMCDGFLEHAKNRKRGTVQNIGWLCLESFSRGELHILIDHMDKKLGIKCTLSKVPWGFGYRVRIGGPSLQKFISMVYPYILDYFEYKTPLFYKNMNRADMSLPNAEQYICKYECVEDIVRHPTKVGRT